MSMSQSGHCFHLHYTKILTFFTRTMLNGFGTSQWPVRSQFSPHKIYTQVLMNAVKFQSLYSSDFSAGPFHRNMRETFRKSEA